MSKFSIDLIGNLVAVEYEPASKGRIVLPDWKQSLQGVVLAVGPGAPLYNGRLAPVQTKVGNRVSFGAAVGMESVYDGKPVRILRDTDIDLVLEAA